MLLYSFFILVDTNNDIFLHYNKPGKFILVCISFKEEDYEVLLNLMSSTNEVFNKSG